MEEVIMRRLVEALIFGEQHYLDAVGYSLFISDTGEINQKNVELFRAFVVPDTFEIYACGYSTSGKIYTIEFRGKKFIIG